MWLRQGPAGVEVWAPAKLNLFLEVQFKRDDGFHELETLMCRVDWFDTLRMSALDSDEVRFVCRHAAPDCHVGDVPTDRDNLVVRAVNRVREFAGVSRGARIELISCIPAAAGLAGGSSDAAAALVAANRVWNLGLPLDELLRLAAELGSDVPFFLTSAAALCRGRGERIERAAWRSRLHLVVAVPDDRLRTPDVFAACRPPAQPVSIGGMADAAKRGDYGSIGRCLHNRLQEAALELSPAVGRLSRQFDAMNLVGHQMSGSGTSYFGICHHRQHARQVASRLRAGGWSTVRAVATCP